MGNTSIVNNNSESDGVVSSDGDGDCARTRTANLVLGVSPSSSHPSLSSVSANMVLGLVNHLLQLLVCC